MKFIRFPQAVAQVDIPGIGPVPFCIEGLASILCVQFTDEEIKEMKRKGGRLYLIVPTAPDGVSPMLVTPSVKSPYITPNMKINDKDDPAR